MNQDFERLIGRAVTDKKFRDALLADSEGAATGAGFKLSKEEMKQLKEGIEKAKTKFASDQFDQMFGTVKGNWL